MTTLAHALRRRRLGMIALAFTVTTFFATGMVSLSLRYVAASGMESAARISATQFTIGWDESSDEELGAGWHVSHELHRFYSDGAWRPYHGAVGPWPTHSRFHYLVVPLWIMPVAAFAFLAYTHGVVRGIRLAPADHCRSCGYDLRGAARADGVCVCPECGHRAATP